MNCDNCDYGLFNVENINSNANKSILLNEINCINNKIDLYGCINLKGLISKN